MFKCLQRHLIRMSVCVGRRPYSLFEEPWTGVETRMLSPWSLLWHWWCAVCYYYYYYYNIYRAHKFKRAWVRSAGVARWGTWLTRKGKRWVLRLRLKEPMDGNSLMFCGIEFQTVGAANRKTLRPMVLAVKGTCRRLSEEERRGLYIYNNS